MRNDREVEKAERNHAQTLAMLTFIGMGVLLYWGESHLDGMQKSALRDILKFALYIAAFFGVFTISPMTDFYQNRISRHRRK